MMTERKKRTIRALKEALEYCGYDMDALMGTKSRERTYADLRAIVWAIYQKEMNYAFQQVGLDFGWNRGTVFSAIRRAGELREVDRNFADMYDSVAGAFTNALAAIDDNKNNNQ